MKIVLVGPSSPLKGGIANFNDSLYNSLKKNHDVVIISYSLQYPSLFFPGRSQYENGAPAAQKGVLPLINTLNPFSWRKTVTEIGKIKPDLLVAHYWMPYFAPALGTISRHAKKRSGTRTIGLLHNVEPHERSPASGILNSYFLKSCDGFIAMSSKVLNDIERYVKGKPAKRLFHPVYDIFGEPVPRQIAFEHLKLDPDQRHLLFFGIIRRYKGLDLLLEALASRRISHINLKLIIAGEFYEKGDRYIDLAMKLGIEKKVMFTGGFVPNSEVGNYFAASDLVVLPYKSATQSGITQIAYHFEKPMLVTDVGGLAEMVPDRKAGYVCRRDPDDIAAAIADFFDNDRSAMFISNIKTEKKKFSWEAMVKGIEELAEQIGSPR